MFIGLLLLLTVLLIADPAMADPHEKAAASDLISGIFGFVGDVITGIFDMVGNLGKALTGGSDG